MAPSNLVAELMASFSKAAILAALLANQSAADHVNQWKGSWAFHRVLICYLPSIDKNSHRDRRIAVAISWAGREMGGETEPPKKRQLHTPRP